MYNEYCEMIRSLVEETRKEIGKGVFCPGVDGDGLGKAVDMIKDLADAAKNHYEACYYKAVVEAMQDYEDKEENNWNDDFGIRGYNHNRNAKGQFSSRNSRSMNVQGFHPDYRMMNPRLYEDLMNNPMTKNMVMGYSDDGMMNSDHGRIYDEYRMAKRNYTQTRSTSDKAMADERAEEYVVHGLQNFLDIYRDADPTLRKKLKENFMGAVEEMA